MIYGNYNPTTYEYTPPELHPDYDWSDGLRPGDFSTARMKLGGSLFEELLQASPEIGIELKRLAKLQYSEVHQHRLRSLIKGVFDTEYLQAMNRGSVGTPEWEETKQRLIDQHVQYAERWYPNDTARIKRDRKDFDEQLAEIEAAAVPKTADDPEYQFIRGHVHRHADIIAYWCMADFSRYPECWYCAPPPAEPVKSLWDMELELAQQAEKARIKPVDSSRVRASRNVSKHGKPFIRLTPEQLAEQERIRIAEEEQYQRDEEEANKNLAAYEKKRRMIEDSNIEDMIVAAPNTAAELAVKLGHRKKPVQTFKEIKRVVKVVKRS